MRSILQIMADASYREICDLFLQEQRVTAAEVVRLLGRPMPGAMEDLLSHGLLVRSGEDLMSTTVLERSIVLADGINSGNIQDIISRLYALYPTLRKVSVVADVTEKFLSAICKLPSAGTIAICSPWIRLSEAEWSGLERLFEKSLLLGEESSIFVTMRPPRPRDPHREVVAQTIARFKSLGAEVIENPRVHAKLYVRVPADVPGEEIAVIGSQNLTHTSYDELGLFVDNDRELVRELYGAFFAIAEGRLS